MHPDASVATQRVTPAPAAFGMFHSRAGSSVYAAHRSPFVVAQHAAPFAVLLASTALLFGCAMRRTTYEYGFGVTGVVLTQDDKPLSGADVALEVNGPVYEIVDLVKTRHAVTTETGGFMFMYISHEPGVKYTISVRKDGFESVTVSGAAPPNGNHVIRLKRAAEPAKAGY